MCRTEWDGSASAAPSNATVGWVHDRGPCGSVRLSASPKPQREIVGSLSRGVQHALRALLMPIRAVGMGG